MPVFGTQMFGSAGASEGTVTFTGKAGSSSNLTSYSYSVDCGDGGDMVVATFTQSGGLPSISSYSLDGQTITSKKTEDDASEVAIAIGTCTGVSSGSNTFAVTWSRSCYRSMVFVWKVENVDIVTMEQALSADALSISMSSYTAGSVICVGCGTASSSEFSGASGVTYDGNQKEEGNMTGGNDKAADASTSISFSGTSNRPLIVALELSPG